MLGRLIELFTPPELILTLFAGKEESGNATQHHVQMSVPDGGGAVWAEHQMQYAYGDQTAAPVSTLQDQPLQFATRESSDYASHHNTWLPHASTGVVYPPNPPSVPSMPEVLLTLLVLSFIFGWFVSGKFDVMLFLAA